MEEQRFILFKLMTYNIGGGRKDFGSKLSDVIEVIDKEEPDILVIQEVTEFQDADGGWHNVLGQIAKTEVFRRYSHFGPTLSMREHPEME